MDAKELASHMNETWNFILTILSSIYKKFQTWK